MRASTAPAARLANSPAASVIGVPATDENLPPWFTAQRPVVARDAKRSVVGLRTRVIEKNVRKVMPEARSKLGCQAYGWRGRSPEKRVVERQLQHLLVGRARQFLAAVADVYAPKSRHAVEHGVPLGIVDHAALGTHDDAAPALLRLQLVVALRRQMMRYIQTAQFGKFSA